jgi:hypothetical protein
MMLAACGSTDVKETLGLNRKAPDEFQVYARPPLSVPPEFNLRPPAQGAEYATGVPATLQAHSKVLGAEGGSVSTDAPALSGMQLLSTPMTGPASTAVPAVSATTLPSNADAQFLADIGSAKADPHIREEIEQDAVNSQGPKNDKYLLGNNKDSDPLVDPAKEASRLQQDKAQSKPPTTGDTPVITPKNNSILDEIF